MKKEKEGDGRSFIPFLMTKNKTPSNNGLQAPLLRRFDPNGRD